MEQKQTKAFITQTVGMVGAALGGIVFTFISWFYFTTNQTISTQIGDWGAFGDYFGGIMNPLVACAALFLLAKSLKIQHQELSETRKALSEASQSQAEQAKIAAQQADISMYSMIFQKVTTALEGEMAYRNALISIGWNKGYYTSAPGKDGKLKRSDNLIREAAKKIEELEQHQELIITMLSELRTATGQNGPLFPTFEFKFNKEPDE